MTQTDVKDKRDFPLERILTTSATEYVSMVGKELADFRPQGIIGGQVTWDRGPEYSLMDELPEGTEAVVGYTVITVIGKDFHGGPESVQYAIGTALIPKKTER